MAERRLKLGIVGGLGARAGADILAKLVQFTPTKSEGDHREIIFEQRPLTEAMLVDNPAYVPTHRKFHVFDALIRMEQSGCDAALLPCFITHTFLEELRAELQIDLISICDALVGHLRSHHPNARRIGILTTPYTKACGLFETLFAGQTIIYPEAGVEAAMLAAIYGPAGFKAGGPRAAIRRDVQLAALSCAAQGADLIVPGMTELPLLMDGRLDGADIPVLDVNAIYARFALAQTTQASFTAFKVGVVGGVGPAATVDFLAKLVAATDAVRDQDHIKLIVEQNPQIPDRTANLLGEGADPTLALYSTCRKLIRGGAQVIAIPCNTAHAYVGRIQRHLDVPIINILTETARHVAANTPPGNSVAILATDGTLATGLYQSALRDAGLNPLLPTPEAQMAVMEAIYGDAGVKAGFRTGRCSERLSFALRKAKDAGAGVAILGCTELPLIDLAPEDAHLLTLIDPAMVLAQTCVRVSRSLSTADR